MKLMTISNHHIYKHVLFDDKKYTELDILHNVRGMWYLINSTKLDDDLLSNDFDEITFHYIIVNDDNELLNLKNILL